jgi:hypothetical protein
MFGSIRGRILWTAGLLSASAAGLLLTTQRAQSDDGLVQRPASIPGHQLRVVDDENTGNAEPGPVLTGASLVEFLLEAPVAAKDAPKIAADFKPFEKSLKLKWDDDFLYVGSNGFPDHEMMVGITNWQQQVPIPQSYFDKNAWRIPLHPVAADKPVSIKGKFLRGAIALAVNGVPIFNPQNNRGELSQEIGELDKFGGHCGRADDYHYHAAPLFLEKTVGPGKPIAYALDGYPIYGSTGPDGKPVDEKTLDAFHGKTDAAGNYAYYAGTKYPFVNGGFHGKVTEKQGQVDPQPRAEPIREAGEPLRGAKVTAFKVNKPDSYTLKYEVDGEVRTINYTVESDGSYEFEFIDGHGNKRRETYHRRPPGGGGPPR